MAGKMVNHVAQNPKEQGHRIFSTVVVSRPGVMLQSLRALPGAYPFIRVVACAGDGLTALNRVTRHQPGLLVIDSNLLVEEVEALLVAVKSKAPATRWLISVQSSQSRARLLAGGADAVIKRDSTGQQWQETLFQLSQAATL